MSHLNVLLIEDSPSDAKLLTAMMKSIANQPLHVEVITRLEEAQTCLEAANYHVILLDLSLPDSDSNSTIRQIERLIRHTPVIVLTGLADNDTGVMAVEAGAQDYLIKQNLNADSLMRSIRYALARQQAHEVKQQALLLEAELERERYLNDLKTEFVNIVSHEFRTPLSIILSSNDILQNHYDQLTPEKRIRRFEHIRAAVHRMNTMVENILLLGQSENGKLQINRQPVNLVELCHHIVDDLASINNEGRIQFAPQSGCLKDALLDKVLIRQVITNLMTNALKYSDETTIVTFTLVCTQDHFVFTIEDQGIGIPMEAQKNLFTPFYRVDNGLKKQGTGLGLVIVKKIVEAHGGTIHIQSELSAGTSVSVTIPVETEESTLHITRRQKSAE